MILYLCIIGFVSILGQVVILRELNVAFFGIELIYILALAIWLAGTAAGASIGRRAFIPSLPQISLLFIVFGILLPIDVAFIRLVRVIFSDVPGAFLSFPGQIIAMGIALLPPSILLGLLFQWAARQYVSGSRTLAQAYAIESVGGLAGGLASTLLLKYGVQNFSIAVLCSLISLVGILFYAKKERIRLQGILSILLAGIFLLTLWKSAPLDLRMSGWNHPHLVAAEDTPYSRVAVTALNEQVSLFENDALLYESESTAAEEFTHLSALQHPNPQRVLVLGGGIEGIIRELNYYSLQKIDYVEINRLLADLAREYLPGEISRSLNAKNLRIIFEDPREFLKTCESYDLILVGMPDPASAQANRFYTREFFEQCAACLSPQGILAFRLRSAENLWSPQMTRRNTSIYRALHAVFRDIVVLPGAVNVFIASQELLTREPTLLVQRFSDRKIPARLISDGYIRYLYTNDRFFQISGILSAGTAPPNSDVLPVCYQYTIAIWLSKFFPRFGLWELPSISGRNWLFYAAILLLLIVLLLISRRWMTFRMALLAGIAGFWGMVVETALILHYQVHSGILFQNIGILLMGFMAGLSLGAFATYKLINFSGPKSSSSRRAGFALLISCIALSLALGRIVAAGNMGGIFGTVILLLLCGFLVAGVFSFASLYRVENQQVVISPLYSADLIGGCLGSVAASLVLIPMIGMAGVSYLMAVLALLALILL